MYNHKYHSEDLNSYNFLVTGGAGFIGSNIVEYLLKHNAGGVRVLDNFSTGNMENIDIFLTHPNFELLEGDIRDVNTCNKAMHNIDYVSHQAALGSVPRSIDDPITSNNVNVGGFLNILIAAKDARVKRMVYAASSSTYGDDTNLPKVEDKIGRPLSPYAVTKYVNELYANVVSTIYGYHSIGLRYFNVFGPRQNPDGPYAAVIPLFMECALKQIPPFINGDGTISRDFTFVENAVQANIKALFAKKIAHSEIINIACGEQTSLNELWHCICLNTGAEINPIYREERKGDIKHSLADITKAADLIGYNPLFSVASGLEKTQKWYKNFYSSVI